MSFEKLKLAVKYNITRQANFDRTKIGGKCQNSNETFWSNFQTMCRLHALSLLKPGIVWQKQWWAKRDHFYDFAKRSRQVHWVSLDFSRAKAVKTNLFCHSSSQQSKKSSLRSQLLSNHLCIEPRYQWPVWPPQFSRPRNKFISQEFLMRSCWQITKTSILCHERIYQSSSSLIGFTI